MRAVLAHPEIRIWARRLEAAEELAGEVGATVSPSVDAALFGAEVVCTTTGAAEPIVEKRWLARGAHVNAGRLLLPDHARARHGDGRGATSFFTDRRESCLNEAGGLHSRRSRGGDRPGPHQGRARRGARAGAVPGSRARGRAHRVRVARDRCGGSRLGRARRPAPARARRGRRGSTSQSRSGDIEAARERIAGTVIRTPLVRLQIDDAPAEIWLKLENLQPIGSFKLRGAANAVFERPAGGVGGRARHDEHREHGAGHRVDGARARRTGDDRRPRQRIRGEARGRRAARRPGSSAFRGRQWWAAVQVRRRGARSGRRRLGVLRPSGPGSTRHGGQRHDRAGARRAARRLSTPCSSLGGAAD